MTTTHYITEIDSTVAGIPCRIGVVDYEAYVPAYTSGPPEYCYPSEGGTADFHILDRKGYRAKWIERKLTSRMEDDIQEEIFNHMEGK